MQNPLKKSSLLRLNNWQVSVIILLWYTMLTILAENEALCKANTMKENVRPVMTWPEKGSTGNRFNLQAKMGLTDDSELYGALHVSYLLSFTLIISEDLQHCVWDAVNKARLNYWIKWPHQPKHIISTSTVMRWF